MRKSHPDGLTGQVVLLTGASSGIGAALALELSRKGARLALCARREDKLRGLQKKCPNQTLIIPGDVTEPKDRKRMVQAALERWGRVDILVNNAGLGFYGDFLDADEDLWRGIMEVNFMAPVLLTRAVLPHMLKQKSGLILNIASIGGLVAHSDKVTPYVAGKHALVGVSRGLAKDLAGTDIRVKAVCPHLTLTEFFSTSHGAAEMAGVVDEIKDFMDTPEDVARGIIAGMNAPGLVLFPTPKPERAYRKMREL